MKAGAHRCQTLTGFPTNNFCAVVVFTMVSMMVTTITT